jgi:hypothetical protein
VLSGSLNAAILLYATVALLVLARTLSEGSRNRLPWNGYRVFGVVLSLAWPVLFAIVAALVLRERRWRRDLE